MDLLYRCVYLQLEYYNSQSKAHNLFSYSCVSSRSFGRLVLNDDPRCEQLRQWIAGEPRSSTRRRAQSRSKIDKAQGAGEKTPEEMSGKELEGLRWEGLTLIEICVTFLCAQSNRERNGGEERGKKRAREGEGKWGKIERVSESEIPVYNSCLSHQPN